MSPHTYLPPASHYQPMTSRFMSGLFLLLSIGLFGFSFPAAADEADEAQKTQVKAALGQLPLLFIENRGQLNPQVAYYVQGSVNTLYFTPAGVTFALTGPAEDAAAAEEAPPQTEVEKPEPERRPANLPAARQRWVVKLDFLDANPNVKPQAEAPQKAVISYFKGQAEDWQTGLKTYSRLRYSELWPGIDLVYSGTVNRLKYHFEVKPGADPNQIRLAYRGASRVTLTDAGELAVMTPVGGFKDDRPVAWQEIDEKRVAVTTDYALEPAGDGSQAYRFRVGSYDSSRPLVLDPAVFVYIGYIGGGSGARGVGIAVDSDGNATSSSF